MSRARTPVSQGSRWCRSFTIVEILVVIGIISVLIAMLFPILAKARRSALVLACPLAYVGEDGGLYLTNDNGTAELRISPPGWRVESRQGLDSPMVWSPSGRVLAFRFYEPNQSRGGWVFMDVMNGNVWPARGGAIGGWIDNDTYLASGAYFHQTINVYTGRAVDSFRLPDDRHYDTFARVPATCNGAFIASFHGDSPSHIALVGKDYQPRKRVYTGPAIGTHHHHTPQVDPAGEWVAWSFNGELYIHGLRDSSFTPAHLLRLPNEYTEVEFGDWTEDSRIVVTATTYRGGNNVLALVGTDGRFVRTIPVTVPPARGMVATYRKYEHR